LIDLFFLKLLIILFEKKVDSDRKAEYDQALLNILKKIKKEIKEIELISEREWLLEKAEEIIKEQTEVN